MTSNPIADLIISVVLQVQLGGAVSYSYRCLDVRKPRDAALFVFLVGSSIANTYAIESFLFRLLPKTMDLFQASMTASVLVVICMVVGHLIDRTPSRFRWWD